MKWNSQHKRLNAVSHKRILKTRVVMKKNQKIARNTKTIATPLPASCRTLVARSLPATYNLLVWLAV
jgi:hypothetical protein